MTALPKLHTPSTVRWADHQTAPQKSQKKSLQLLAKAIYKAVLNCIAFIGHLMTLGLFLRPTTSAIQLNSPLTTTLKKAGYFLEPNRDRLNSEIRSNRVRIGHELIAKKLKKELELAQKQAAEEPPKQFKYVSAPADFKGELHSEQVSGLEVGACHFIGKRPSMEDEHLTTSFDLKVANKLYPVRLFGVFDGHGGNGASFYMKKNLQEKLHEALNRFCSAGLTDETIWNALKITFVELNKEFNEKDSGTTATVAMILDKKLWTANVGDSRTILDNGIQLSEDAKPTDPRYKKGVEDRGGLVFGERVNGILAVARAVGDHSVGAVNPRPKITVYPLSDRLKGSHLILACDGIYDVSSTKQVASSVRDHKDRSSVDLARDIVYSALQAGSTDNLSAVVVKL